MGCKFSALTTARSVVIPFSTEMLQVVHKFSQAKFFAGGDIQCPNNVQLSLHFCLKINYGSNVVPKPAWPPPPTNELWFQLYGSWMVLYAVSKCTMRLLHCEAYQHSGKLWRELQNIPLVAVVNKEEPALSFQFYQGSTLFDSEVSKWTSQITSCSLLHCWAHDWPPIRAILGKLTGGTAATTTKPLSSKQVGLG